MAKYDEMTMTGGEYALARRRLGFSKYALGRILGVTPTTIKQRERDFTETKREAAMAMRWLLDHPPTEDYLPPQAPKSVKFSRGERFGTFTIIAIRTNQGKPRPWHPTYLDLRCDCGRGTHCKASDLTPAKACGRKCPARLAIAARGSTIDALGDIIDADGFPER